MHEAIYNKAYGKSPIIASAVNMDFSKSRAMISHL